MPDPCALRIALVTTARSDYSTMLPVMKAAQRDPSIEPLVFCSGMHWLPRFGETWRRLEEDGLEIAEKIDFFVDRDDPVSLGRSLGSGVAAYAEALDRRKPHFVIAPGDRLENLSLLSAATALRIPVAHLCGGGDLTEGALDNQVRHAMTKLSHLHFVALPEHARRVLQMGEEPWRITITGETALDAIATFAPLSRAELRAQQGIPADRRLVLSTFHPQTLGTGDAALQFGNVLRVLEASTAVPVLTYPNIDPGFEPLLALLEGFRARRPDAVIVRSFTPRQYYSVMAHAEYMIGNSSSGIWEAPSFGLPVVNVGARQAGRLRAGNVIDVRGDDPAEIEAAVRRASDPSFRGPLRGLRNPYGDGRASERALAVLKRTPVDDRLLTKKFFELDLDPAKYGVAGLEA